MKVQNAVFILLSTLTGASIVLTSPVYAVQPMQPPETVLPKKAQGYSATTLAVAVPEKADVDDTVDVSDPYEKFNRSMFSFNEGLDKYILKPVSKFYNLIMPRPLNEGVHNFFVNLDTVPTIVNDVLQFNFHQMANDMWRFGVNSTIGIGGLFDIATRIKLNSYRTDFGLTMAKWGYANSSYVVLPFWGPRTVRDSVSIPIDYYFFSLWPYIEPDRLRYGLYALSVIDWRAQVLKHDDLMEAAAVDKYAFVRNAYLQYRRQAIESTKHRTYEDLREYDTPIAVVDASQIQASDDMPTLEYAE